MAKLTGYSGTTEAKWTGHGEKVRPNGLVIVGEKGPDGLVTAGRQRS